MGGVFVRRNDDIFTLDSNDGFIKRFSHPYSKKNFMSDEDKMNHGIIGNISYFKSKMTFSLFLKKKLFYGVYDKNLNATKISQSNSEQDINGFNNDIDGFVDFYPSYSTNSNEIVGKVNAEIVYEWFQNNSDKISSLLKKLQAFKRIKPEDNPIMMIVKSN